MLTYTLSQVRSYDFDKQKSHFINKGYIPVGVDKPDTAEGWLRIRSATQRQNEYRNVGITVVRSQVEEDTFDLLPMYVNYGPYNEILERTRIIYQHYVLQDQDIDDRGEHPVLFSGIINSDGEEMKVEGIHFRSGYILGTVALSTTLELPTAEV
jgi:hypothetical protein